MFKFVDFEVTEEVKYAAMWFKCLEENGIVTDLTPSYTPSLNGIAERCQATIPTTS
jgi:transposase InsO family protein